MATHAQISESDITYILENPWRFTDFEWKLFDERDKMRASIFLNEKLAQSREGGYSKIWKTPDGLPLALMGAYIVDDKKLEGFFVASKHMDEEKHALKITFELRQLLKEQSYIYKGCKLGLYSESEQVENQLSWLRLIGFKYTPAGNRGNTRYFEYTSKVN